MDNINSTGLREALRAFTMEGLAAMASSEFGTEGYQTTIAYYDTAKDEVLQRLSSYESAVAALAAHPAIPVLYGAEEAPRLALQFAYTAVGHARATSPEGPFESTWREFEQELQTPHWSFVAVANVQNFQCAEPRIELAEGIVFRHRSFNELRSFLRWGDAELNFLREDFRHAPPSSYVLTLERHVPKSPETFLLEDDGTAFLLAGRILLALRLFAPGDIRVGRIFLARPSAFNVGLGGISSLGFSFWHLGPAYNLSSADVPSVRRIYQELVAFDSGAIRTAPNLSLAIRSFSSIYDRFQHQTEDRVIDAITALEALWRLDSELAFRLAFRTSSLLATSEDERLGLFRTLREYYIVRSRIVHGNTLSQEQAMLVRDDEPLRSIVRRSILAFIHLAMNPGSWTVPRVYQEADTALLHAAIRREMQIAMGIQT